ncbi:DUF2975 domain-containing protein [Nonomuraea sp. NPDC050663]|uniref:DUF2975 domain-containing protein n=1 Tax=Nonomuraea sp. NPDC050663 TaxID=3364370 RepID=UPI0037914E33
MPTRSSWFVGPLILLIRLTGGLWAIFGVAYVINGFTQVGGHVTVTVKPLGNQVVMPELALPAGVSLEPPSDRVDLVAWGSTPAEQFLTRADTLVIGLCAVAGALLLRWLLDSIREGTPFRDGNARIVRQLAGLLALSALAGAAFPMAAAMLVLSRIGATDSFHADTPFPYAAVALALIMLVLARVFEAGATFVQDGAPAPGA